MMKAVLLIGLVSFSIQTKESTMKLTAQQIEDLQEEVYDYLRAKLPEDVWNGLCDKEFPSKLDTLLYEHCYEEEDE